MFDESVLEDVVDAVTGDDRLPQLFSAQVESRILDHTARWLRAQGHGYYTIGSAGHESNAVVATALRIDDPALLHYRSGALVMARSRHHASATPLFDTLPVLDRRGYRYYFLYTITGYGKESVVMTVTSTWRMAGAPSVTATLALRRPVSARA